VIIFFPPRKTATDGTLSHQAAQIMPGIGRLHASSKRRLDEAAGQNTVQHLSGFTKNGREKRG